MMRADISVNRKALHEYHILERFEAGVELKGTEVKSIRAGLANVTGAFGKVEKNQLWLYGVDVQAYAKASYEQHESKRERRALLKRREINHLAEMTQIAGHSIVVLRLYWKEHLVKVELGLGRGKLAHDKREDIKAKAEKREADRTAANFNRSRA